MLEMPLFHDISKPAGPVLTDEMVRNAEKILGLSLPVSYINLLKKCNGGGLRKNAFPVKGDKDNTYLIHMDNFMSIGGEDSIEELGIYLVEEWGYPKPSVVISCIDGHSSILLDYRDLKPGEEPSVVEYYADGDVATTLAPNFQAFVEGLVCDDSTYVWSYKSLPEGQITKLNSLGELKVDDFGGWRTCTVNFSDTPGYESKKAYLYIRRNHYSDGSGSIYPDLPDYQWICSLDVEDSIAELTIEKIHRVLQSEQDNYIRIFNPVRYE